MERDITLSPVYQYSAGCWEPEEIHIITEAPVSLTVNGEDWLSFMCTPTDIDALAVGFLYCEGVIESMDEVASLRVCPTGDNVDVWLSHQVHQPERWRRTSGCTGGVTSVDIHQDRTALGGNLPTVSQTPDGFTLSPERICTLIGRLYERQDLYQQTGGVHSSALSDGESIIFTAEDVGRHNTIDKLAGQVLINRIPPSSHVLITTGRISSEMIQKAARLGVQVVISRTSPTTLSIQLAEEWGITLVGYARRNSFRVYTHPYRLYQERSTG